MNVPIYVYKYLLFLEGSLQSRGTQASLCLFPTPTPLDNQYLDPLRYIVKILEELLSLKLLNFKKP